MCPIPKMRIVPNRIISQFFDTVSYLFADAMIWVMIMFENDTTIEKSYWNVWLACERARRSRDSNHYSAS